MVASRVFTSPMTRRLKFKVKQGFLRSCSNEKELEVAKQKVQPVRNKFR